MVPTMFVNIFLLSLLTIIYGTKGEEGGGGGSAVERNTLNFLPDASQQRLSDDLNFIKTPRSIRTPFRNTEIMTARGFGKRDGEDQEYSDSYKKTSTDQQNNDDYRDEAFSNHFRQKQLLFPFSNQLLRNQDELMERDGSVIPAIKNHRVQIRDGTLKFRLNDGNLRIGRGFGKRNFGSDPYVDNFKAMQFFRRLSQNQQVSPLFSSARDEKK